MTQAEAINRKRDDSFHNDDPLRQWKTPDPFGGVLSPVDYDDTHEENMPEIVDRVTELTSVPQHIK